MATNHLDHRVNSAGLVHSASITSAGTVTSDATVGLAGVRHATAYYDFNYGSGGTAATFYLQTSHDGTNWMDIACVALGTVTADRVSHHSSVGSTSIVTPTDGSLSDNTAIAGVLGDQFRVKQVTTGTYASTSVAVTLVTKG